jgi:hypothetical protein
MLADRHLPRYVQRYLTAAEAQRDAPPHAVRVNTNGVFATLTPGDGGRSGRRPGTSVETLQ